VRSTAAPYTESRLTHLVRNKCVGFPVVEHCLSLTNAALLVCVFFHKLKFFADFHYLSFIFSRRHYIESELSSEASRVGELGAQRPVLHVPKNDGARSTRARITAETH
jgi:hypothetical protein